MFYYRKDLFENPKEKADFKAKLESEFNKMIERATQP